MLGFNALQLAMQNSITGRKFFDALFRLKRVGPRRHCHSSFAYTRQKSDVCTRNYFLKSEYRAIRLFSTSRSARSEGPNADLGSNSLKLGNKLEEEQDEELQAATKRLSKNQDEPERLGKPFKSLKHGHPRPFIRYTNRPPFRFGIENVKIKDRSPKVEESQVEHVGERHQEADPFRQRDVTKGALHDKKHNPHNLFREPWFHRHQKIKANTLGEKVRYIMRDVPQSVVALTTAMPTLEPTYSPELSRGMALSSLTTVTLGDSPIISFNIKTPSHTLDALKLSRRFLIHFLLGNESGARIANDLTQPFEDQTIFKATDHSFWNSLEVIPFPLRLYGMNKTHKHVTLPLLYGGGLRGPILRCEVLRSEDGPGFENVKDGFVQVGDHTIVLARVRQVIAGVDDYDKRVREEIYDTFPLSYYRGFYRSFPPRPMVIRPVRAPQFEKKERPVEVKVQDEEPMSEGEYLPSTQNENGTADDPNQKSDS